jgi:hypothetical protein
MELKEKWNFWIFYGRDSLISQTKILSMETEINKEGNDRPQFLKVICILSFIFTIAYSFMYTVALMSGSPDSDSLDEQKSEAMASISQMREMGYEDMANSFLKVQRYSEFRLDHFYTVVPFDLVVVLLGFVAVFFMWTRRKLGFQLYILYSVLSVVSYFFFVAMDDVPFLMVYFNLVLSGLFVWMYSKNRHWLI